MSKTIQKFIERLGWKVNDYSWDGNAHLFHVDEPANLDAQFEQLRLAFKATGKLGAERRGAAFDIVFGQLQRAPRHAQRRRREQLGADAPKRKFIEVARIDGPARSRTAMHDKR